MNLSTLLQATANATLVEDLMRHPVAVGAAFAALFSALLAALKLMVMKFVSDVTGKLKAHDASIAEHAISIEGGVRDAAGIRESTERIEFAMVRVSESVGELSQANADHHTEFVSRLVRLESKMPNGELQTIATLLSEIKAKLDHRRILGDE